MQILDKVAVTFQIVMTKIDKPNKDQLQQSVDKTRKSLEKHPAAFPEIILTSSTKMDGIETIRTTIAKIE